MHADQIRKQYDPPSLNSLTMAHMLRTFSRNFEEGIAD